MPAPKRDTEKGRREDTERDNLRVPASPRLRVFARLLFGLLVSSATAFAEQRFPPPDFESGYQLPSAATPPPRAALLQYLDVAVFVAALGGKSRRLVQNAAGVHRIVTPGELGAETGY